MTRRRQKQKQIILSKIGQKRSRAKKKWGQAHEEYVVKKSSESKKIKRVHEKMNPNAQTFLFMHNHTLHNTLHQVHIVYLKQEGRVEEGICTR